MGNLPLSFGRDPTATDRNHQFEYASQVCTLIPGCTGYEISGWAQGCSRYLAGGRRDQRKRITDYLDTVPDLGFIGVGYFLVAVSDRQLWNDLEKKFAAVHALASLCLGVRPQCSFTNVTEVAFRAVCYGWPFSVGAMAIPGAPCRRRRRKRQHRETARPQVSS